MVLTHNKAQGLSEYAMLIGVVAAAAIMMQMYLKRGIQSAIKTTADDLGNCANQYYPLFTPQTMGTIEPGLVGYVINTPITATTHQSSNMWEYPDSSGAPKRHVISESQSQINGGWTVTQKLEGASERFKAVDSLKNPP